MNIRYHKGKKIVDSLEYQESTCIVHDKNASNGYRYIGLFEMRELLPEYKKVLLMTDKIMEEKRKQDDCPSIENGRLIASPHSQLEIAWLLDAEDRYLAGSEECFVIEDHPKYVSVIIFPYLGKARDVGIKLREYDDRLFMNAYGWGAMLKYYAGCSNSAGTAFAERYEFRFYKNAEKNEPAMASAKRLLGILNDIAENPEKIIKWIDETEFTEWDDW